jgi:5,10-methenyltetrahydromethanopterin hydrogenase
MKIDPKEYSVEILNDDGHFVELDDVLNVTVNTSEVRGDEVIERVIDNIMIDCIIKGKATLLLGNEDKFRFKKRT